MNRFAWLLDRLAYEPRRNAKVRLLVDYFTSEADPDRGYALAAMTGTLSFRNAKAGLIRGLIMERVDPVLFGLSYDYVGDLSETVALMWPVPSGAETGLGHNRPPPPSITEVVETLQTASRGDLPRVVARWLDHLDETGRWALLKLITGNLRIGVSARLAKTAVAQIGEVGVNEVEEVWHGLQPPYEPLFRWIEKSGPRPEAIDPAPFRPPMLSHPLEDTPDFATKLAAEDFSVEWKWDGIRVQAVAGISPDGRKVTRLYSRTGEEITGAFPDLVEALDQDRSFLGAMDGELLVVIDGRVQSFNVLQQRLNRKTISPKLLADFPAHIRAYDQMCRRDSLKFRLPGAEAEDEADASDALPIRGLKGDLPVTLAPNGGAVPGDRIVGILNPGEGITIYPIQSAALAAFENEPDRWLDVRWDLEQDQTQRFPARIALKSINEPGSLAQITHVIAEHDGNIDNISMNRPTPDFTDVIIDLSVWDLKHLNAIIAQLRGKSVVSKVERVTG